MNALYVIGNINLGTVRSVAENIKNVASYKFDKLFIISTDDSHKMILEQQNIYSEILGNMRAEEVVLDINNPEEQKKLVSIFKESNKRFIDLTNGLKPIAAMLYMAANLCEIDDLYYLMRDIDGSSKYIKMNRFVETEAFTEFAFYDLVFYNQEIDTIFQNDNSKAGSYIRKCHNDLKNAVSLFFIQKDYKNTIIAATSCVEKVIPELLNYLQNKQDILNFANAAEVNLYKKGDPIGIETFFFKKFLDPKHIKRNLVKNIEYLYQLHDVPWILSMLREYRNAAAHYSKHKHIFTESEARLVLNASIELYRTLRNNEELWSTLHES